MSSGGKDLYTDNTLLRKIMDGVNDIDGGSTSVARLADILVAVQDVYSAVDELEIKAESINLNTDELEAKLDTLIANIGTGLATEATLDAVKTATEKIDDLQGALKSVDTDSLVSRITDGVSEVALTGTSLNVNTTNNPTFNGGVEDAATLRTTEATDSQLNTNIALQTTLAHGDSAADSVIFVDDVTARTSLSFRGIKVHEAITLAAGCTFTNVTNAPGTGDILQPDYYPFAGTAFEISSGTATLINV